MAKLLVWDESVDGVVPWKKVTATCLVNDAHPITSIINWVATKTKKYSGRETLYIVGHGYPGWLQLGSGWINEENVHLWGKLRIPTQIDTRSACKSTLVPIEIGTYSEANRHPYLG